ncbi:MULTISPECIES: protein kinase domain-containing protein [unclassified Janthinobacterium]|uniref:protein kinase domain-containing protein n=1 Tax=unclassified Janthinobacterium TaxID=2610881 RepID=UPI00161C4C4D|nr:MULTISPECIES: protein kinase [unclassified Janthinobacterium]MBB5606129.1 serine/threonine-protein kinase [Janthinobacterium sp. S3T4]MBB5611998.1 serine/threonine-protein kinase [Janthinobacterium sp. S3M3]
MPALDDKVIQDVTVRLQTYLATKVGYSVPVYLTSGGSAAIFQVQSPAGPRAFKVFDPKFFAGESGDAERRRLEVQRRLIGHECASLVQTYQVEEALGTAFMEMEFVPWVDLNKALAQVPDTEVATLIKQLVEAARFLEDQGIVHRDIKPENIKIASDFKTLKLLDLGVARDIEAPEGADAAVTDHGKLRPFLATAQYSSPEYLFRLDKPSDRLWKALNFYQIGAVLHDLIMKVPLFNQEMEAGNRWLVSKAVLTKTPSFAGGEVNRLRDLKALSARCLVKDLDLRLQIVGWDDFLLEGANDALSALRDRLTKCAVSVGPQAKAAAEARLEFERNSFAKSFMDRVRTELISACGTSLPITMPDSPDKLTYTYLFSPPEAVTIQCQVMVVWGTELRARDAQLSISAVVCHGKDNVNASMPDPLLTCTVSIGVNEEIAVGALTRTIAKAVGTGLDIIELVDNIENIQIRSLI